MQEPDIIKWWKLKWPLFVKLDSEEKPILPLLTSLCSESDFQLTEFGNLLALLDASPWSPGAPFGHGR